MHQRLPGWDPGFAPQDFVALAGVTTGPVVLAGSSELCAEASACKGEPAIAVGAADATDVTAAVRFAADFGLPLIVLSPGHEPSGSEDGGLLLTTSRMNRVHIDRVNRTALAGAGALWSDVVRRAAEVGLAPLVPPCGDMSVVGPDYGWAAGHVKAIEYVTPDAQLRRVTPVSDRRLFAQLCGSDPTEPGVGVITEMTFVLFR
jgi:FAD/FMN-containing dehydrogenase